MAKSRILLILKELKSLHSQHRKIYPATQSHVNFAEERIISIRVYGFNPSSAKAGHIRECSTYIGSPTILVL